MLKYNDLRIGNLVEYEGQFYEIHSLSKEFPTLNTIEFGVGVVDWNNIKPIKLTTDILIDYGFEFLETVNFSEFSKYERWVLYNIIDGTSSFEVRIASTIYDGINNNQIFFCIDEEVQFIHYTEFLHDLQNVFYMCSGFELKKIK